MGLLVPVYTLVMLAHAILTVVAARERNRPRLDDQALIPLTVKEIRHLFGKLVSNTIHTLGHWLAWSHWRRRHQARATTKPLPPPRPTPSINQHRHNNPRLELGRFLDRGLWWRSGLARSQMMSNPWGRGGGWRCKRL
jgi:hypothetical protein